MAVARQRPVMHYGDDGSLPWGSGSLGAPDQPEDEEQHHRADHGDDEAADAPLEVGPLSGEQAEQEPAQEGADNADDDVFQPALLAIRSRDHTGHPARQGPEDDPRDDAQAAIHGSPSHALRRIGTSHPAY